MARVTYGMKLVNQYIALKNIVKFVIIYKINVADGNIKRVGLGLHRMRKSIGSKVIAMMTVLGALFLIIILINYFI